MDGESATGRLGKKYYYYQCSDRECGMRVAAHEVEEAIVDRLQLLAGDQELLARLTAETNRKLQQGRPNLELEYVGLEKDIKEVKAMADKPLSAEKIANRWLISRDELMEFAKTYNSNRGRPRTKRKYTKRSPIWQAN